MERNRTNYHCFIKQYDTIADFRYEVFVYWISIYTGTVCYICIYLREFGFDHKQKSLNIALKISN